jgi:hypothetical protein
VLKKVCLPFWKRGVFFVLHATETNYCKNLFGDPEEEKLSMDESRTDDIHQVSDVESSFLTAPYTEEQIKRVVFQIKRNKALGPHVSSRTFRTSLSQMC